MSLCRTQRLLLSCALAGWLLGLLPASATKVVLRIRAGNPIEEPQTVAIKSPLPDRVTTNDIISLGGLELGYDVKSEKYYVHGQVELGPREIQIYDVEIEDIWRIPEDQLTRMEARSAGLVEMLTETEYHDDALALQQDIRIGIQGIREHQAENRIRPGVPPLQHIRAYEANLEVLERVEKDVGRVENLVLGAGLDPGGLIGAARDAAPPRPPEIPAEAYRPVVIRITVRNTSPTETRRIPFSRDLPEEIAPADVLDADGLDVEVDSKRGVTVVTKKNLEIGPNETLTFNVRIRDKWNVNVQRIDALRERVQAMLGQIGEKEQYASVDAELQRLLAELDRIRRETGPETLNSEYVAFYREQGGRVDEVEHVVHRIEEALRPVDKRVKKGFRIQAPSLKTTWLIIYIILGFLALLSLLFFLRWMGRTKKEE